MKKFSSIFSKFVALQIYGANTGVGKTVMSAGLVKSSLFFNRNAQILYLKPLQTGTDVGDDDALFVKKYAAGDVPNTASRLVTKSLYKYGAPLSPHLASSIGNNKNNDNNKIVVPSDDELMKEISLQLFQFSLSSPKPYMAIVESAGGPLSPTANGISQADAYRWLRLPVLLVADSKLGGISTTLAAYESLVIRGYDVEAILSFEGGSLKNLDAIKKNILSSTHHRITSSPIFVSFSDLDPNWNDIKVSEWFDSNLDKFDEVNNLLQERHEKRLLDLSNLGKRAKDAIWWPFTQHSLVQDVTVIDSAFGDYFQVIKNKLDFDGNNNNDNVKEMIKSMEAKELFTGAEITDDLINERSSIDTSLFDSCGSWWTQGIGHGKLNITLAAAYAAGRYGHVMFPENSHAPAIYLAEELLSSVGKNWASRVFYSDNGACGMEIALKMAFRKSLLSHSKDHDDNGNGNLLVAGIRGSYHGDTHGVLEVQSPNAFTKRERWYKGNRGVWFDAPTVKYVKGEWQLHIPKSIAISNDHHHHRYNNNNNNNNNNNAEKEEEGGDNNDLILKESELSFLNVKEKKEDVDNECISLPNTFTNIAERKKQHRQTIEIYSKYILNQLKNHKEKEIGALVIEPVLHGAGGMVIIDPLFQNVLVEIFKSIKIPVIFDEVFVGCWRIGAETASSIIDVKPDIACYAKLLSGGLVPLAVTLTSNSIFESFLGNSKQDALLHGHSYTGNPVGCAVSLEALRSYKSISTNSNYDTTENQMKPIWDSARIKQISNLQVVESVSVIGTVFAFKLSKEQMTYSSTASSVYIQILRQRGIFARSLGTTVYVMMTPFATRTDANQILDQVLSSLQK